MIRFFFLNIQCIARISLDLLKQNIHISIPTEFAGYTRICNNQNH